MSLIPEEEDELSGPFFPSKILRGLYQRRDICLLGGDPACGKETVKELLPADVVLGGRNRGFLCREPIAGVGKDFIDEVSLSEGSSEMFAEPL